MIRLLNIYFLIIFSESDQHLHLFLFLFLFFFLALIQLECNACGNTWFAARDDFTSLTSEAPVVVGSVGTAPWATAKFEGAEQSRCKSQSDAFKKSADVYFPVLGTQKSFSKARAAADPSSAPHKSDTSSAKKW